LTDISPQTLLDRALASAQQDRTLAPDFYDAFLNSEIVIPVQREDRIAGKWEQLGPKDRFFPLFIEFSEAKAVPVFDTLDRLKTWATGRDLDYLSVKSYVLLQILAPNIALVLNVDTDWTYTFTAEVLDDLRRAMRPVTAQ